MTSEAKKEKKSKTKKNPKGKTVTTSIEFKLTDTQKAEKGMEAAKLQKEVNELVVEKKIIVDEFAAKIKARSSRVSALLTEIDCGIEVKDTECTEVKNFDRNVVEYFIDGEVAKKRELTEQDRQLELEEASAAKGKKKAKDKADAASPKTPEQVAEDNAKACVAVPGKKQPRGRQEIDPEIESVMKEETGRKTKHSSVDGPLAQA